MTDTETETAYRKRQISMWEFAPDGAFRVFRDVDTGLSRATCEFVFYDRNTGALITDDCDEDLKQRLTALEPQL